MVLVFWSFLYHGVHILLDWLPENLFAFATGLAGAGVFHFLASRIPLPVEDPFYPLYAEQFAYFPGATVLILVVLTPIVVAVLFLIGYCLLACLERVSAMLLHISLSVFVFAAARSRAKRGYLAFAIGLHAIFDMPAALYQFGYVKQLFPVELWLAVCALYALRSARKCYLEECDA